jgi:hypothetical protein
VPIKGGEVDDFGLRDQMEPAYGITGELALSGQLLSVKESSRSTWKQAAATFHCEERRGSCSGGGCRHLRKSVRSCWSFRFLREDIDPAVRSLNGWSDIGAAEPQNPYLEMRL